MPYCTHGFVFMHNCWQCLSGAGACNCGMRYCAEISALTLGLNTESKGSATALQFEPLMEQLLAMDEPLRKKAYQLLYNSGCRIGR